MKKSVKKISIIVSVFVVLTLILSLLFAAFFRSLLTDRKTLFSFKKLINSFKDKGTYKLFIFIWFAFIVLIAMYFFKIKMTNKEKKNTFKTFEGMPFKKYFDLYDPKILTLNTNNFKDFPKGIIINSRFKTRNLHFNALENEHGIVVSSSIKLMDMFFVFPMLSLNAQGTVKPCFVVSDFYEESYQNTFKTFLDNSYNVLRLNLLDSSRTIKFNPFYPLVKLRSLNKISEEKIDTFIFDVAMMIAGFKLKKTDKYYSQTVKLFAGIIFELSTSSSLENVFTFKDIYKLVSLDFSAFLKTFPSKNQDVSKYSLAFIKNYTKETGQIILELAEEALAEFLTVPILKLTEKTEEALLSLIGPTIIYIATNKNKVNNRLTTILTYSLTLLFEETKETYCLSHELESFMDIKNFSSLLEKTKDVHFLFLENNIETLQKIFENESFGFKMLLDTKDEKLTAWFQKGVNRSENSEEVALMPLVIGDSYFLSKTNVLVKTKLVPYFDQRCVRIKIFKQNN